jgi:cell division protease FtsH
MAETPDAPRQRTTPTPPRNRQPHPWRVEGHDPEAEQQSPQRRLRPPGGRRFWWFVIALFAINWILTLTLSQPTNRPSVPYTFFRSEVVKNNVRDMTSRGDQIQGDFRRSTKVPDHKSPTVKFKTVQPAISQDNQLLQLLIKNDVEVNAKPLDQGRSFWATLLLGFGPTLLLVGLFVFFARRAAGGGAGGIAGLGRSRAKRYEASEQRTTFDDVAGIDEAEQELVEVVDFLRNPGKYRKLGAAIPKGVLLSGQPGTGKTLLARAVAGEADVPFFSLSASEFIEIVVGVGASRVRDLFDQAKKAAPAIIFIDELDAIGRQRGGGASLGGHDEREQTLNQILTEMDGFTGSEGVIVLAATNRPEILDPALLRPGRFDRRVTVNPPDAAGRRKILEVHTRHVPLAANVDLGSIASSTPGMVGADLRNLVNEAALTAARRAHERVQLGDFTDALERIVLGAERRITLSVEERERTAYHESGHALLGMLEPGADPVRKISIVPRGRALGVTFQSPATDRYGYDARYLRGRIVGALGGRAAEEIIYGNVTTGAESDLEQVTAIAKQMVGRWGMSDKIGLVSVLPGPNDDPVLFPGNGSGPSEETRQIIDSEVRRIVEESYERAVALLRENRDRLERLAQALLEHETLDERDAYETAGFPPPGGSDERAGRADAPSAEGVGVSASTGEPEPD